MTQLKPVNQKTSTWQRTTLLATDNSHSIIDEVLDGKHNPIAYTAYGEQSARQEGKARLGFNGQLREGKIGWYLLGNGYRAYNPRLMRFHSPDSWSPFGGGGLNAYMYCVGDPVNRSDPTGHMIDLIILGFSLIKKKLHLPGYRAKALGPVLTPEQTSAALWGLHETKMKILRSEVRPTSSAGLASIMFTVGTSHKMPGGSPAIIDIGPTTVKSHPGYSAGAAVGAASYGLTRRPSNAASIVSFEPSLSNHAKASKVSGSISDASSQQLNIASDQLSHQRQSLPSYNQALPPNYEQAQLNVIKAQEFIAYTNQFRQLS